MAEGKGMTEGVMAGYGLPLAARHLTRGIALPRMAMREAGTALGEPWRLALVVTSGLAAILADPAEDGVPRYLLSLAEAQETPAGKLAAILPWIGAILGLILSLYYAVASLLWMFTRPAASRPRYAAILSAVAVGTWVSTLPVVIVGLAFQWLGLDILGGTLCVALWAAFVGIGLSEATGLDARAGMALSLGSAILASVLLVVLIYGFAVSLVLPELDAFQSRLPQ